MGSAMPSGLHRNYGAHHLHFITLPVIGDRSDRVGNFKGRANRPGSGAPLGRGSYLIELPGVETPGYCQTSSGRSLIKRPPDAFGKANLKLESGAFSSGEDLGFLRRCRA
jgi:hypothetical protein